MKPVLSVIIVCAVIVTVLLLVGANTASGSQTVNPPSADAMVVAAVALGCAALAGVVAAKKTR